MCNGRAVLHEANIGEIDTMKSRPPHSGIDRPVAGRFLSCWLPLIALGIAMTLGGCVVYVPGHYHGGWHHHYYD